MDNRLSYNCSALGTENDALIRNMRNEKCNLILLIQQNYLYLLINTINMRKPKSFEEYVMQQNVINTPNTTERSDKGKKRPYYKSNLPKQYLSYQRRANVKQISFELSVEQFNNIINQDCSYCGEQGPNGVDRINSLKGYISSNVTACCTKCNMMKYTYTVDEFKKHIKRVYNHLYAIEM